MIIKVKRRDNPFTQVDNSTVRDKRLSFKARGLLIYLLSQVDGWNFNIDDAANHSTDGKASIYSAMRELKEFGYAETHVIRSDDNKYAQGSYTLIREIPEIHKT
jgi:hypothetical protein